MLKVIIGCEHSGTVREAFRKLGHDAWSCDLLPADDASPFHLQEDIFNVLSKPWDLAILHPPCTFLCSSGLHWNTRDPERAAKTEAALQFVGALWEASAHIPAVATENSIGCISTRFRPSDQIIQPHQFGHDASKSTALWLKGLPKLVPTEHFPPRLVMKGGKTYRRWSNQTDSGQNRLPPSADRWKLRSKTYEGIARAMAAQWSAHLAQSSAPVYSPISK